ncbi:MAG: hypothetical protein QM778_23135 [Myxococcales bacterium]
MFSLPRLSVFPIGLALVGFGVGFGSLRAHAQAPADDDVEISVEATPAAPPAKPAAPAAAPAAAAAAPAPATPVEAASQADVTALRNQLQALEKRLADSQAQAQAQAAAEAQNKADAEAQAQSKAAVEAKQQSEADEARKKEDILSRIAKYGVHLSGYIQVQYGRNELSQDELQQGGSPLNQNRFAVRRGRLRVNGRWKYFRTDFEVDGSNTRGPTMSVRRASISGVLPGSDPDGLPLLLLTVGLTEIPLGLELQQGQDDILFLERSTGSLALFPGPVDTGAKLEGAYSVFRAQFAVMNGVPLDDRAGGPSGIDPTSKPDYLGRVGIDTKPMDKLHIAGGVSFLSGTGFHPGTNATKSVLGWNDSDHDGKFTLSEVEQSAAVGRTPSATFDRWAAGADLSVDFDTKAGNTRVYGEVLLASNLDRALYVADPTFSKRDIRELSWYVAGIQEITEYAFIGARYDVYDPDSDFTDSRKGTVYNHDLSIKTLSPIIGVRWPGVARLTFQYDFVNDNLARDKRGVPTDLANNAWTLRAQGRF